MQAEIASELPKTGFEKAPFKKGTGDWNGVVMIIRPEWPIDTDMCKVLSACTIEYGGRRAIGCMVPYGLVRQYFDAFDGQEVHVFAEFKNAPNGGHLEFYEKASQLEFFLTAGGADRMYLSGDRKQVY